MEASSFGDVERPNIPCALAIQFKNDIVLFTFGSSFMAVNTTSKAVEYMGNALHNCSISFAASSKDEFALALHSKLLERRRCSDGSLIARYITDMRLSGLALYENGVVIADKFGNVELTSWESIEQRSSRVVQGIRTHMINNPRDEAFRQQNAWVIELFSDAVDSKSAATSEPKETLSVQPVADCNSRNKFDSGKDLSVMLEEFKECMGSSLMGHLATVTMLAVPQNIGRALCISCDKDEKIRISSMPDLWNIDAIFCGHSEFITDVVALNDRTFLSAGGDKTLRLWSLDRASQVGKSLELDAVPFRIVPVGDNRFLVLCALSQTVMEVTASESELHLTASRTLAAVPVALMNESLFLDVDGSVWIDGKVISSFESPAQLSFMRYWKHDREEGALTTEERLAKRLRHSRVDE